MKKFSFVFFLIFYVLVGYAQHETSHSDTSKIEIRLLDVEKKVNSLEFNRDNLKDFFNNGLDNKKNELEAKFNETVKGLKDSSFVNFWALVGSIIFLIITLLGCGLYVFFSYLPKKLDELTKKIVKEADQKIANQLKEKIETILLKNKML
jgi:predicted PurR-regulated permease PerM